MRAILIDDEKSNLELTFNLLGLYCRQVQVVATAGSVEEGYQAILQHQPDLIFLDVQMQDGTGFDLLDRFPILNFKIIFITAHQDFALAALKRSAVDFLLKPLSPPDIIDAVIKAQNIVSGNEQAEKLKTLLENIQDSRSQKQKLVLKTMDRIYSVPVSDIIRFHSEGSYTEVYLKDGKKIVVSKLIKDFEELLSPENFIRVHQSHLVNVDFIFSFGKAENTITLTDDSTVPVSVRKKDSLMALLNSK